MNMTVEQRIRTALDYFNQGDLEGYLETLYAPDAILHYLPPGLESIAGTRLFYSMIMAAFPGVQIIVRDFVQEGDKAAVRFEMSGVQKGEFMGIPASGFSFSIQGITTLRFENGKCVERWSETDMLGLMTQIGAVPA
jgi:predicted ester cyclase